MSKLASLVGLFVLGGMLFFGIAEPCRAAGPSDGIGHLRHLGYYNPYSYTSRYLFYPFYGGAYPYYNYQPYYGWGFPSRPAQARQEEHKEPDTSAHLTVTLPTDAEIWFNGTKMLTTGSVRHFSSPPLTPGRRYVYEVRVRWEKKGQPITQTRKVIVSAGADIEVDFVRSDGTEK